MLILYGVLTAGAIVFAFPFLWMVGSSIKVRRELAAEEQRLLPRQPVPQASTPYIDSDAFEPPLRPDAIPLLVWEHVWPQLETLILQRLDDWTVRTPNDKEPIDIGALDEDAYRHEMAEGVLDALATRISDKARNRAIEVEHQLRKAGQPVQPLPPDHELINQLSEAAVNAGAEAILTNAEELIDDKLLRQTFDEIYRRFCLGECRARTADYKMHALGSGKQWSVTRGPATLTLHGELKNTFQHVALDLSDEADSALFTFVPSDQTRADEVDRLFVAYRGDAGWSRLEFQVIRNQQLYRTEQVVNLFDRDWVEAQLRWPEGVGDPMERQPYLILRAAGPAPPNSPPLAVRLRVQRNSAPGAWWDKVLRNYRVVFRELPFGRYIMTSLALSLLNIVLTIFSCTLAAYAFARLRWPGRNLCFGIMLATMMIPGQVTMIPGFLIHKHLGWYNTLLPLWVHAAFGSAFFIFLLRQFFKTIPTDLEDAARIDGCGFLRIYWHVMLPLVIPTIAAIAIFTFIGVWNNFMGPLIYVNDERLFPLALGLFKFKLRSSEDIGMLMAASFVMTLPIIVLFFFVQRYFIQGITLTGLKG